jgi:endonuclease/exonuclease/phosphatase family metal-dependent hydrolase
MRTKGQTMKKASSHNINILTFNTHVGIRASSDAYRLINAWKHFLPSSDKVKNLNRIAEILKHFDIVGIQESDGGSLRSDFINHTIHLAYVSGFDYCSEKVTRELGFARHSLGLLSKYRIIAAEKLSLPGSIPGRGMLIASLDVAGSPMTAAVVHLSLGKKDRINQAHFISEVIRDRKGSILLMGDFNCCHSSTEMKVITRKTCLQHASCGIATYPSWRPFRSIDHLLVSEDISVTDSQALKFRLSDHLPLAVKARLNDTKKQGI